MSNIVPLADIQSMAEVAAKSRMFGFKNTEEAMAIMLLCQAEDLHPAIAMRDYHVIQGRPALKADAMLARFQKAGGSVQWKVYTDEEVTGTFSHPSGGTLDVTWTLKHAKGIGIANKDNWKNYSRAMLRARCVSEGIRSVYPGCVVGVYTPEETQDFTPPKPVSKDMGMVEEVKVIEEAEDAPFKLYIPGLEDPHSAYYTPEEWIDAYITILEKIVNSSKLDVDEKSKKCSSLYAENMLTQGLFPTADKIKLKARISEAGVDPLTHVPTTHATIDI